MPNATDWAARCRAWLRDAHLPLWANHGVDWTGWGFHERLDAATLAPTGPDRRRSMVCARQLYLWSAASRAFGTADYRALAERAYATLVDRFPDRVNGGWVFSLTGTGTLLDGRKDFYAHAFILFALAHYAVIGERRTEALMLARVAWGLIRQKLTLPQGWLAAEAAADWTIAEAGLVQNPHMHLLEALLALQAIDPTPEYRVGLVAILDLFQTRLYQAGVLGEFFNAAGEPSGAAGQILEPGHHFEWAWLLQTAASVLDDARLPPLAAALTAWAGSIGTDAGRGGAFDQLGRDGQILQATKRIWPQSEAVKAYAAAYAAAPSPETMAPLQARLAFLFDHYLLADGRWHEHLDADLRPIAADLPGSTPYHIAFALLDAAEALDAAPVSRHPHTPIGA